MAIDKKTRPTSTLASASVSHLRSDVRRVKAAAHQRRQKGNGAHPRRTDVEIEEALNIAHQHFDRGVEEDRDQRHGHGHDGRMFMMRIERSRRGDETVVWAIQLNS